MGTRKVWLTVLVISIAVLAGGIGLWRAGAVQAQPPAEQSVSSLTLSYPGRLSDEAGKPVAAGRYDFTFAVYATEAGGEPLWSEQQEGVAVTDGTFLVSLGSTQPIPRELLGKSDLWLAVGVRGPGATTFTALTPRQHLRATTAEAPAGPEAAAACAHTHWGETWTGTGNALYFDASATSGAQIWINSILTSIAASGEAGVGVYGKSNLNHGIVGESTNGAGIFGDNIGPGGGTYAYGGFFESDSEHGDVGLGGDVGRVSAHENPDSTLYLSANGDIILKLDNNGGGDNVLRVKNSGGTDVCTITEAGVLTCLVPPASAVDVANLGRLALQSIQSPEAWFEDFGTATLVDGRAVVTIDPLFAKTVNLNADYHVFLTPLGDCQGLYVAAKTPTSFEVRELGGGKAGISFDYRIVAKQLGREGVRLEQVPWQTQEAQPWP